MIGVHVVDQVEDTAEYIVVTDLTIEFDSIFNRQIYKDYAEVLGLIKLYEQV